MAGLDPLKKIVFNEGEPLDVDKLNAIVSNTTTSWQASNVVYNNTVNSQSEPWVPVIEMDQVSLPSMAAGKMYTIPLNLGDSFNGLPTPRVVATYRSGLVEGQQVSVAVVGITGASPSIQVISNKAETSKVVIDWIAISKKTIATA